MIYDMEVFLPVIKFKKQKQNKTKQNKTLYDFYFSIVIVLIYSPIMTQISLKNSFGKVVFHIFAEIEMMRNQIDHWPPFWNGIFWGRGYFFLLKMVSV